MRKFLQLIHNKRNTVYKLVPIDKIACIRTICPGEVGFTDGWRSIVYYDDGAHDGTAVPLTDLQEYVITFGGELCQM